MIFETSALLIAEFGLNINFQLTVCQFTIHSSFALSEYLIAHHVISEKLEIVALDKSSQQRVKISIFIASILVTSAFGLNFLLAGTVIIPFSKAFATTLAVQSDLTISVKGNLEVSDLE
jgi:hypothetical protein